MAQPVLFIAVVALTWCAFARSSLAQVLPGSVDESFNPGPISSSVPWIEYPVETIALQSDGRILLGGSFTNLSGEPVNGMARLLPSGAVDETFRFPGVDPTEASVTRILLSPDEEIIVAGNFTGVGGVSRPGLARLTSDGRLDENFNPEIPGGGSHQLLGMQTDGKPFVEHHDLIGSRMLRLNQDGSVDPAFESNVLGNQLAGVWQSDQAKLLVGGIFSLVDGQLHRGLIRLNPDGTVDHSFKAEFEPGSGLPPIIRAVAVQPDGKLLVGGGYQSPFGPLRSLIRRLNQDGTVDPTFQGSDLFGSSTDVTSIVLQKDGKAVVAGQYATDGLSRQPNPWVLVKRVLNDGSVDPGFFGGSGTIIEALDVPSVNMLLAQADGKLLICGRFYSVNELPRMGIARLNGASVPALEQCRSAEGRLTFSFLALSAWEYSLEFKSRAADAWNVLEVYSGDDNVRMVSDSISRPHCFYRVVARKKP